MRLAARLALLLAVTLLPGAAQAADPSIAGRILFVKDGDLWLLDATGPHELATGGTFSQPAWSPDGSTFAYVYRGTNFADIFVSDDQGQSQTRLTNSQSTILDNNDWNLRPAYSPDGLYISFVSDRASALPTLWLINADGTGRRALNTPGLNEEAVDSMTWSPDGNQLAFTLFNEPGPTQIAVVPLTPRQTGHMLTAQPGGALDPTWSPDGNWLAYAGHAGNAIELYAVPMQSGATDPTQLTPIRLTSDGQLARSPVWSPDGGHIAYLSNKSGYFEVYEVDVTADASGNLRASTPRQLTQDLHLDAASGLSWGR